MINQNTPSEQTKIAFLKAFKALRLVTLLRQSGIRKAQGISVTEVFEFLLLLVFMGKNLYRYLDSKYQETAVSKNTYYRFLNTSTYNWRRFLTSLSVRVIASFSRLTRPDRVKVFILDDSVVSRNRSKDVELLANLYDHAAHRFIKGFTMLALGWSDGYSFIPTDFAMMSSASQSNRLKEISEAIDKRTSGYKRRSEAMKKKTDVALQMIRNALTQGIPADYVLMDTWFTHEPMIRSILDEGLDVIGMVKQLKQRYQYKDGFYTLPQLRQLLPEHTPGNQFGSIIVKTKNGIPVKLVFVRNRNNKRDWLTVLSTDLSLSDAEIIRIYGNRWSIEVFFKSTKSLMKLGTEFQGRSYDMMISHTTIVFTRYILLEWLRRNENDDKTLCELFFRLCDDIQDMALSTALQSLMSLFVEQLNLVGSRKSTLLKNQLQQWIDSQASFIKALFGQLGWES
jgi:Transposase DDE domain.